jgi:hypothetical protein
VADVIENFGGNTSPADLRDRRRRLVDAANYAAAVKSLEDEGRLPDDDAGALSQDADAEVNAAVAGVFAVILTHDQRRERREARASD